MKQTLHLRLGQQLAMTPQLQQAIRLLQLSSVELQAEIQQALESNVMLERQDEESEASHGDRAEQQNQPSEPASAADSDLQALDISKEGEAIPSELPVDTRWEDVYEPGFPSGGGGATEENREFEFQGNTATESLGEHLRWQVQMGNFSQTDQIIAEAIIDAISDDGYLATPLEEIHQLLTADLPELESDELTAVLHRIQNFDPPGVGARNLQESLLLQLRQLPADAPWLSEAKMVIQRHFNLLAKRDYTQLMRRSQLDEESLHQVIQLIQSLNPRPGGHISSSSPEYVVPDVFVTKVNGNWRVELNPENAPRLGINAHYASMVRRGDNTTDNVCLKNHLQEARWFLKSLQSRSETLLKVASTIVERQRDFLEHGELGMKPMVLHDIAESVDMHESTISRVTTRKYIHTPRGVFELKYFFSSHVKTSGGGEVSSTAIQAHIKKLVLGEEPKKPLSDSKIAQILSERGIKVARRTVAKYREIMNIPPSSERKRLA